MNTCKLQNFYITDALGPTDFIQILSRLSFLEAQSIRTSEPKEATVVGKKFHFRRMEINALKTEKKNVKHC